MTDSKFKLISWAAVTAIVASPAAANPSEIFFIGDLNCGMDRGEKGPLNPRGVVWGGWSSTADHSGTYSCKSGKSCDNDYIKSIFILNTVKPGTVITLWDSPNGDEKDDWVRIVVGRGGPRDTIPLSNFAGICVASLEMNRARANYTITYHGVNGLNGKVSRIEILPPR